MDLARNDADGPRALAWMIVIAAASVGSNLAFACATPFAALAAVAALQLRRRSSLVLPSEGDAFAMRIVLRILEVNVVAYAGLTVIHRLAVGIGLLAPAAAHRAATA